MKPMKGLVLFFIIASLSLSFFSPLRGEGISFSGFSQVWFSYAQQHDDEENAYGFNIRRLRLKPYGQLSPSLSWTIQFGWDENSAKIIDAYLTWKISKPFNLNLGQCNAPGAAGGWLLKATEIDLIERDTILKMWARKAGLSSWRSLGVNIFGELMDGKLNYAFMMSNPKTANLFIHSLRDSTYFKEENGLSYWARLEAKPLAGLRCGAFYNTIDYSNSDVTNNSYGAHFFFQTEKINFKIEYMAGEAETEKYSGMYALLGYKLNKIEPVARFGYYRPNEGKPDKAGVKNYRNVTLGINYFYSTDVKIQVNYILRSEEGVKLNNNMFYINLQYIFKSEK